MKVLVSLGFFDDSGEGQILGVDLATGHKEVLVSYFPPPFLRVPARGFTGACLSEDGSAVYAAGHSAVYRICTRTWTVDGTLHMSSFNDVHHVAASGGQLYVANTGSDSVDVFSEAGRFIGAYMLTPPWVLAHKMQGTPPPIKLDVHQAGWEIDKSASVHWLSTAAEIDKIVEEDGYHTAPSMQAVTPYWQTKLPDRLHPNHTCLLPSQMLVTCFRDGSIRDLRTLQIVHQQSGTHPHDGVVAGGRFYFTTIDGTLWALALVDGAVIHVPKDVTRADPSAEYLVRRWDLPAKTGRYGWCRGLLVDPAATGVSAAVGFTEVRRERLPRHEWCARLPEGSQTGVVWLELAAGRTLGWVDLSDSQRHSKIYSILPWSGA